jgi:hypothetical protein
MYNSDDAEVGISIAVLDTNKKETNWPYQIGCRNKNFNNNLL